MKKVSREEEKHGVTQVQFQRGYDELQTPRDSPDNTPNNLTKIDRNEEHRTKNHEIIETIENTYRTFFENYTLAITVVDQQERIVSWNKYTEELFGMNEKELYLKTVSSLYPAEEWKRIRAENIRQKGIRYRMETKMIGKENILFDAEISLCVLKNEQGKIIGSVGIINDITKQKEIEKALEKSEKKFKQLYEKAPLPYHTLSPSGIITDVNEMWCKTLGYTKEEVLGQPIFIFIIENEREVAELSFKKKLQNKNPFSPANERIYITKNGEKRIFMIRDFLSFDEDNSVNVIYTIMNDVTDLKKIQKELKEHQEHLEILVAERTSELESINTRLQQEINEREKIEKQRQRMHEQLQIANKDLEQKVKDRTAEIRSILKHKDEFINQLGHDLKNPLNPLVNLLPILEKNEQNQKNKEIISMLIRNVNYMKNLVTKMIELARLNSSNTKFIFEDINLLLEMDSIIENNKFLLNENHIEIKNNLPDDITVSADKLRFTELINNLLNNAIKYSNGPGMIFLDAKQDDTFVTISIKDTGIGMSEGQLQHIFNEFYKADTTRHDFDSSGLGLSICKHIIERHNGKIWAESDGLGKGSTFYFTVPRGKLKHENVSLKEIYNVIDNMDIKNIK